jgi:hypothetical protein
VDAYPAAAAWRQAAGARHRALIGVERRRSNRQGASEVGLSAWYHFIQGSLFRAGSSHILAHGAGRPMSALGQKQTLQLHDLMSALPPKADIRHCSGSRRLGMHCHRAA